MIPSYKVQNTSTVFVFNVPYASIDSFNKSYVIKNKLRLAAIVYNYDKWVESCKKWILITNSFMFKIKEQKIWYSVLFNAHIYSMFTHIWFGPSF